MRTATAIGLALVTACQPDLGPSDGLVTRPTVLAIKAEPPEAKAGATATYSALVAVPMSAATDGGATVTWNFCTAPKTLTTDNAVASGCFDPALLVPAGTGTSTMAATSADACALFGPQTPSGGARPRDPDATGGYYQPLRADVTGADPSFYLARLSCGLGAAPADVVTDFAQHYVPNTNPHLAPLTATMNGASIALASIPAGATVTLRAGWSASDAETYVEFDPGSQALSTKREAMGIAWHASAGAFATESTGRSENDLATSTDDTWSAPDAAGHATLWIVLRDSRGGTDFATYDVTMTP